MKLKIEFIDQDTGRRIVVKNKDTKVLYHNSDTHDSGEYEELSGRVFKLEPKEKEIVETFYKLSSNLF